jgi:hypothetical protein
MKYVTSSVVTIAAANGLLVQVNKALTTETITLAAGGTTFAVITGAVAAGAQFRYSGLRGQGAITVTPSAAVDATVSLLNRDV